MSDWETPQTFQAGSFPNPAAVVNEVTRRFRGWRLEMHPMVRRTGNGTMEFASKKGTATVWVSDGEFVSAILNGEKYKDLEAFLSDVDVL